MRVLAALTFAAALLPFSAGAERAATPFVLKDVSGKKFDLAPHLGKDVVLLNFFATWCAPCMAELPSLQSLHDQYGEKGLKVVVVSIDDPKSAAKVKPLVREQKMTFTVVLDTETKVVSVYNPKKAVPFTVVIDRQGNVVSEHSGFQAGSAARLEKELQDLLVVAESKAAEALETPATDSKPTEPSPVPSP